MAKWDFIMIIFYLYKFPTLLKHELYICKLNSNNYIYKTIMFYHSICSVLCIALLHIFSFAHKNKRVQTLFYILQFFQIAYIQMQTVRQI